MKTIWRTIAILITGAVLLGAGYWIGTTHALISRMWADSALSQSTTRAAMLSTQLSQLNDGKIDDLRSFLNTQLDGEIMILGTLIDWDKPSENDLTAINILRTIAQQWVGTVSHNSDSTVSNKRNTIFEKAKAYSVYEKQKP